MRKGQRVFFALVFFCATLLLYSFSSWAALPVTVVGGSRSQAISSSDDDSAAEQPLRQESGGSQEYVLGTGDRIKLTVYGEADLSGEYEVGSTGIVALPLIGDVRVAGQPIRFFEQAVRKKLAEGYLRDPRVSAQVINYRPFFILGEVSKPGSYPYVNGMTVINAVALAGGYTYRADKSGATITRAHDPEKKDTPAVEEAIVAPGDIIRVPERFF